LGAPASRRLSGAPAAVCSVGAISRQNTRQFRPHARPETTALDFSKRDPIRSIQLKTNLSIDLAEQLTTLSAETGRSAAEMIADALTEPDRRASWRRLDLRWASAWPGMQSKLCVEAEYCA
jgi:hypothetical protein